MAVYLQYSTNGTTFTNLPTPSKISGDGEDIDRDSYRSVTTGNIIRNIVGTKWQKISVEYNYLSESDAASLMNVLKTANGIWLRVKSPIVSSSGVTTIRGYVSKTHFDWIQTSNGNGGYAISFNFVEGTR